jgi:hypothetical protein
MRGVRETCAAIGVAALIGLAPVYAFAADMAAPQTEKSASSVTGSVTLYGWLPFMDGDVGVNGLGPADVSLTPSDIIDVLDFTMMASGDVRWGKVGLFGDLIYLKVSNGAATPGPLYSSASLDVKTTILTGAVTYQLAETDKGWLQGLAGVRYWSFDNTLTLNAGILPTASASATIDWVDPIVGLRGRYAVNDKWFLTGAGIIGGFGAGSDFMWDVVGGVGYKFTDSISASTGYRAFGVDYSKNGDVVDLVNHGPVIGLTYSF